MSQIKLNICSLGDPTNPLTWSGTPFNIYSELLKMDFLGRAFNSISSVTKYEQSFIKLISKLYYNNSIDTEYGFLHRYLNAKKVNKETAKSASDLTLHTGSLDLPFYKLPKNQKHYLFCDSTFKLWSSQLLGSNRHSKKLLFDAEKLEKKSYHQMEHYNTPQ